MEKSIKINIGSGPQGKPDWVNLDWGMLPILSKIPFSLSLLTALRVLPKSYNQPWQSNPRLCDCRRCLPFKSESVDYIYSSHFVEHLMRYQALDLFNECKRILKPEGVMRISVPDLKIFTEKYLSRDLKFFKGITGPDNPEQELANIADLFVRHFYGYDSWSKPNFLQKIQRRFIRGHFWMYDFESLSDILRTAGFKKITRCQPGTGEVPDIEFLDIHREHSLFAEARLNP